MAQLVHNYWELYWAVCDKGSVKEAQFHSSKTVGGGGVEALGSLCVYNV